MDARDKGPFALVAELHDHSHGMGVCMFGANMAFFYAMVLAFAALGAQELWEALSYAWPWFLWGSAIGVCVAALGLTVVSGWMYASRPDSLRAWFRARDGLDLERSSLALMLWAWDRPEASAWPKEATLSSVSWKVDEAGMHAALMAVDNVSGRRLHAWKFEVAPEGLRHRAWPRGATPEWEKANRRAIVRAAFHTISAHRLLALRAVLNPL